MGEKGESQMKAYVGIDISRDTLDMAVYGEDELWQFKNNPKDIARLCSLMNKVKPALVVFEATGGYEDAALYCTLRNRPACRTGKPRQVRDFARQQESWPKQTRWTQRLLPVLHQ